MQFTANVLCAVAYVCGLCSAHWYLAVICFAGLCAPVSSDGKVEKMMQDKVAAAADVCCCLTVGQIFFPNQFSGPDRAVGPVCG